MTAPSERVLHPRRGTHDPVHHLPDLRPGVLRRTSSMDMLRTTGMRGGLTLVGRGRDSRAGVHGDPIVLNEADLLLEVDFMDGRTVRSMDAHPSPPALQQLLGAPAGSGFRRRLGEVLPDEVGSGSLLHLLLDDVPGTALIAGYAVGVAGANETLVHSGHRLAEDVCSGFRQGGTMMLEVARSGQAPLVTGPLAPDLEAADPEGWHELDPLPAQGMRRRRLLDVEVGDVLTVHSWFRDSHVSTAGEETVIHEYQVDATVDPKTLRVLVITAVPRVLPWVECPMAAASASRLLGASLVSVRQDVRSDFIGTSTCTHLNDQLRSLADIPVLAEACTPLE